MGLSYRWWVLFVYSLIAGLSQLLWLNFAPILSVVQAKYGVSEAQASLLILVFPLIYVLVSIPSGSYIDKHGYRKGIGLGALIMAIFACLRVFDSGFMLLLVAQIGIAVSQPLILNGITKLVFDWFAKEHTALATGLGTMGMFFGMAGGMIASPILVEEYGFNGALAVFAVITVVATLAFFVFVKNNPQGHQNQEKHQAGELKLLLRSKNLWILFVLALLGLGFFNGLTTWLEAILAPQGITSKEAGIAGGVLIIGGIFGAGIVPALSDYFRKRRLFLMISIVAAAMTVYPFCQGDSFPKILIFSALQGFFFLPAFSLLLEMCSEIAGEALAASATGVLMLMGNAGGVVVVLAMELVKGDGKDFAPAVHLLFILLVASFGLAYFLPESSPQKHSS